MDMTKNNCRTGLFAYLFFEDLFEESIKYIGNVPLDCDIFIATNDDVKFSKIKQLAGKYLDGHNVEIMLHSEKGRDVAALLVLFKRYCLLYDVICFIHDKKSSQMKYESVGRDFNNHIWNSLLGSSEQVQGVLNAFQEETHLGLLVPSMVTHGEYFHTAIDFWTICYDGTVELAKKLGLNVKINGDKNPLSVGTAFWARTVALNKLFEFEFTYDMFPDEPFPIDGSISHCIERIFSYVALDAGYYTGIVYSKDIAGNLLLNQSYALNQILRRLDKIEGINTATLKTTLETLDRAEFRKKGLDPVFIDSRLLDKEVQLLSEFKEKYSYIHTYNWVLDQLSEGDKVPDNNFLKTFKYKLSKKIKTEIALYRYQLVDIILDGIEDYLNGITAIRQTEFNRKYKEINASLMIDIDRDWYYQCLQMDDCDFLHMLVRKVTLNGYLLQANRKSIVGMDNLRDVQGYRATDITFWDKQTCCGFVCKRDIKRAWKVYWRAKRVFLSLTWKYKHRGYT